ncbi:hypothetical protein IEU95_15125 [Hoyosella rhizosphaerae]|uniref:Uncharacterized protein n=1 Tax=Hoyosella rhizosphaerae TaxID=1755582 RepID=A0A916UGI5_9ACTN|nr:hypothetical protein [Hoyosella rhizosphaerae]MBN4928168.1 hypothetical protein [Hoyosella rhizosphaerae]GGC72940.1 hypothetical protein GCM10011410_27510 [Hoyosella rhizosphaerae]
MSQYPPPPPGSEPPPGDDPNDRPSWENPPSWDTPQSGGFPPPPPPEGNYPPGAPYGSPYGAGGYGAGGYGAGGYGTPTGEFNIGDAIRWAWNKFADNWSVWVGFVAIMAGLLILDMVTDSTFLSLLINVSFTVLGWMLIRGALLTADGAKPAFGDFAQLNNVLHLVLAAIAVSIMVVLGLILLIIPGLIIAFLSMFVTHSVLDNNMDVVSAIKNSWKLVSSNAVSALLLVAAAIGAAVLMLLTCGLGAFVIIPVMTMVSVYAFRTFSGRQPAM